jgi:hypothetical protein
MNKGEFLIKYNVASQLANNAFSKLGLAAKKFTKAYAEEYSDLADEEHFIKKDFAQIGEDKQAKKDQQGQLIMDSTKEKEFVAALKAWKKEPIGFELDKFTPVKIEGKLLFFSPAIYEELNGFVFDVSEEDYLIAIEAEVERQDKEAEEKAKKSK